MSLTRIRLPGRWSCLALHLCESRLLSGFGGLGTESIGRYTLEVPRIPEIVTGSNGFWSVCSYNKTGFNTLSSDFTVGKGVTSPTKIHISSHLQDKRIIPKDDLFLLVPQQPFYIVFCVYAPEDSILLKGNKPFFPEMIVRLV
jgi:hypothetical protein